MQYFKVIYFIQIISIQLTTQLGILNGLNINGLTELIQYIINMFYFQDLRQVWTLYPDNPDNSFLGFTIEKSHHSHPHSQNKQLVEHSMIIAYFILGRE